jgi:hypothetical protein
MTRLETEKAGYCYRWLFGAMASVPKANQRRTFSEDSTLGYYMRYIVADERPVTVAQLQSALSEASADYKFDGDEIEATIIFRGHRVGHLTLNVPGDGLFDAERAELITFAEDGTGSAKQRVIDTLHAARGIVAVQVLFGDGDTERTLASLDPLWHWLHANRTGLLQADGEGYYQQQGLILTLE